MSKKYRKIYWLYLYLFFLPFQHMRAQGAPGVHSGYVAIAHPVVAVLGVAATALTSIAHNAYQEYLEKNKKEDVCCLPDKPDEVVLAGRFYYEQRKEALEKTKQELVGIKKDLETLKGLNSGSFTCQFLKQYSYPEVHNVQLPSISQERCFSEDEKNRLRNVRENELILLEKQVNDIHNFLVLHLNQLIENVRGIETLYQNAMVEIKDAINAWNNNPNAILPEVAFKIYGHYLLREYLITRVRYVFDEVLIVSSYYRICKTECIKSTTTVIIALEEIVSVVTGKKSWLLEEEKLARRNSVILERYFACRNISIIVFKNATQKEFDEEFKKRDAEILKKLAMQQQISTGFGEGPKKNDEDENDRKCFWKNLKSRSDKSARSPRFGKMYRDPITKLWWSRDLSGHGGSSYKVFKEGAKGFEWLFDAVKDGTKMLDKHKGPIGLFIPYKEVIFKT